MSNLLSQASLVMIPSGYKEDVVYSQIPTNGNGDLSFTRASNGTRINSAGLVEVVAWNLLQQSETFDNAAWGYAQTSVSANATTAPNGTSTADKLKTTTVNASHQLFQSFNNENANHTFSIYAKKGELNFIQLALGNSIEQYANFNLNTGVVGTKGSYCASSSIESVGDGWYRCTAYFNQGTMPTLMVWLTNSASSDWGGIVSWAGANNTDGIYIWGAQLNIGSTAKPYFPTTDRLNVPRLTYQNGGGGCPSLLLEKQSTNEALYSNTLETAAWGSVASGTACSITTNDTTSPDGTQNASKITYNTAVTGSGTYSLWRFTKATSSNGTYSISVWLKAGTITKTYIRFSDSGGNRANLECNLTSQWQRFTLTGTTASSISTIAFDIGADGNGGQTQTSGYLYAYGAQLEASSYPTSYIPTTSASATRVADVCSKTGISSLIGQTEGVLFVDLVLKNNISSVNRVVSITESNWISGGSIRIDIQATSIAIDFINNNSSIGGITVITAFAQNTRYKIAVAYKTNDCVLYVNGTQLGTNTSIGTMPTCSEFYLNELGGGFGGPWESTQFNQAILFPTRLTNAELASLTTI